MILVINGTNRPNNRTQVISKFCFDYLSKYYDGEVKYLTLEDLSNNVLNNDMYEKSGQEKSLSILQDELMIPISNWLVITPEYNGSFPGIFKLFIDALSVRNYKDTFDGKKVGLIGTSNGRAGNLRGMEHLTSFLNYLKMTVYHNKLPISSIDSIIKDTQIDTSTSNTLEAYLNNFKKWI